MSEAVEPWSGLRPSTGDIKLDDIVFNIGMILKEAVDGGEGTMPKHIADKVKEQLDLAQLDEEDRKILMDGLLTATEETHKAALRAKHDKELLFLDIVTACRVYGRVSALGVDGGIKAAIDNIKSYAERQAIAAAKDAARDQAPAMYDVFAEHAGKKIFERVMTSAVYILTEDEMVMLEKKITEAVLTKARGGGIQKLPAENR